MTPMPIAPARSHCGEATAIAGSEEFAASIIEEPKLLGIVDVAPGIVTIGLTATVRAGDQDGYLRAVRGAIKIAFDRAAGRRSRPDYRPPAGPAAGRRPADRCTRRGRACGTMDR